MNECKIVLFTANPEGTPLLALDAEAREIEQKIRLAGGGTTAVKLMTRWAAHPSDLLPALNAERPQVVQFSCHGTEAEEIILQDASGKQKPVSKEALVALCRAVKDSVSLVVLNACYSQPQAAAIVEEIDCAIGMKGKIRGDAVVTFTAALYGALGSGLSVQQAFDQGRAEILLEGLPNADVPELITRDGKNAASTYPRCTAPGRSDSGSPRRRSPVDDLKQRRLEKRMVSLTEEYLAASEQLDATLAAVEQVRLQRQLKILEAQMEKVEDDINSLR
jgi:hypothetical protein